MPAPNHICKICGAAYYACNQCDQRHTWRSVCDTPEHYQIYQVLIMFSRDMISRDEAANMLTTLGVTSESVLAFPPEKIDEIMSIIKTQTRKRHAKAKE